MNRLSLSNTPIKRIALATVCAWALIACGSGRSPMTPLEEEFTGGSVSATGGVGGGVSRTGGRPTTGGRITATGGVTTGGRITTGGMIPNTGGYTVYTGGIPLRTGGYVIGTGGLVRTGGTVSWTGGVIIGTGGLVVRTGGYIIGTGGYVIGTGGVVRTGGIPLRTGGVVVPPDAGTRDTACSPIPWCDIYCPYGYRVDANGCGICACNPAPDASVPDTRPDTRTCPDIMCGGVLCPYGFMNDPQGCPTCRCAEGPNGCPGVMCKPCPYGLVMDSKGCYTCECVPDPSIPCNQFTYASTCKASTRNCRWLSPGCDTPAMTTSGCFDPSQLDCTDTCENGLTCLKRSVHPCPGGSCGSCGTFVAVCL